MRYRFRRSDHEDYSARAMVEEIESEVMSIRSYFQLHDDIHPHFAEVQKQKLELLFDILASGRGNGASESVYHRVRRDKLRQLIGQYASKEAV